MLGLEAVDVPLPPPNVKVNVVLAGIVDALASMPVDARAVGVVEAEDAPHVHENWRG